VLAAVATTGSVTAAARQLNLTVLDLVDGGLGAALVPDLALHNHPPRRAKIIALSGLGGRAIDATHVRHRHERRIVRAVLDTPHAAARDYRSTG
jgi:DNA-binding transcriptional LysR family regulator